MSSPASAHNHSSQLSDYDFILKYQDQKDIQSLFSDNSLKSICKLHQLPNNVLLVALSYKVVEQMAAELKILKHKPKLSHQLTETEISQLINENQSQPAMKSMVAYLKWILAKYVPTNSRIQKQQRLSSFKIHKKDQYIAETGSLFTLQEEMRCRYHYMIMPSSPFVSILAKSHELVPIHKHSQLQKRVETSQNEQFSNIHRIGYYPINTANYFNFVTFLQRWLIFPAIIGLITAISNVCLEATADDSVGDFIYAFVIMIWSVFFCEALQQDQQWSQMVNGTGESELWAVQQQVISHRGWTARRSRITGDSEPYVSLLNRLFRRTLSYLALCGIVLFSLFLMIVSLNARGFIDKSHKFIYFRSISQLAEPGGFFDSTTNWAQLANLLHVLVINLFDQHVYRPIARQLCQFQLHPTGETYSNSLISKFFVYQFIITFADLFYIAFVRFDIDGLREQLVSLFFIDIVRRLIAESGVPALTNWYRKRSFAASNAHQPSQKASNSQSTVPQTNHSETAHNHHSLQSQAAFQLSLSQYELFDEYLEIVTNFGYLVMISSVRREIGRSLEATSLLNQCYHILVPNHFYFITLNSLIVSPLFTPISASLWPHSQYLLLTRSNIYTIPIRQPIYFEGNYPSNGKALEFGKLFQNLYAI